MKKILILCLCIVFLQQTRAQLVRFDFETWDTCTSQPSLIYPTDWPLLDNQLTKRSASAQHGMYALQVSAWYYYTKTTAVQYMPVSYKPLSLDGYYTYTDNNVKPLGDTIIVPDTALVSVYMTKWNAALMQRDTVGTGMLLLYGSASYNYFNCPITYMSSTAPDSVYISLDPSLVKRSIHAPSYFAGNPDGYSSYFTVDNLTLQDKPLAVAELQAAKAFHVYPNPGGDEINIVTATAGSYLLYITDATGRVRQSSRVTGHVNVISVVSLPAGVYTMSIRSENGECAGYQKFVKQ